MLKKGLAAAAACAVNGILSFHALLQALGLFDRMVTHYSPAQVLPQWRALPFIGAGYFLVGLPAGLWSSRWWQVAIPSLAFFFYTLMGMHFGADYYPETPWDYLGRPTAAQVFIGFAAAGLMTAGWALVRSRTAYRRTARPASRR